MSGQQANAPLRRPPRIPAVEALPPLVPRSALSVFDEAVAFLRVDPGILFTVAVVVLLPLRIIAVALPGSPLRDARPDQLIDVLIGNLDAPGAVFAAFATLVLESLALFTVGAMYGEAAAAWYGGKEVTAVDLLIASIKRSPAIVVAWGAIHVAEALGAVVSVGLLGIFLGTLFMVTAPALGAEASGGLTSIRRSSSLVSAKLGHALFVFILTGVGAIVMRFAIELAPSALGLELLGVPLWLVSGVADLVASVFVTAFVAAAATVLYIDLRVRREGIDLAMSIPEVFADTGSR
ncbi:MAG: hypothetical protein ACR2P0_19105 [Acidimicrobiales bacterium]